MYRLLVTKSLVPIRMSYPPPVVLALVAELIESWCILVYYTPGFLKNLPGLKSILKEPSGLVANLQPAIFTPCAHTICDDSRARKSVRDGGLGYKGGITTFEGMVELLVECNEAEERERARNGNGKQNGKSIGEKVKEVVVPRPEPVAA